MTRVALNRSQKPLIHTFNNGIEASLKRSSCQFGIGRADCMHWPKGGYPRSQRRATSQRPAAWRLSLEARSRRPQGQQSESLAGPIRWSGGDLARFWLDPDDPRKPFSGAVTQMQGPVHGFSLQASYFCHANPTRRQRCRKIAEFLPLAIDNLDGDDDQRRISLQ
ncbi:hypothetical protein CCHR01_07254 [Colletotrichum chrysophilum]|uniref:Uncharacterized protein n=1 Tax=Colletotrichum chrysophilum TaxID=1836956 RepID=A0AAD9EJV2_9PEZI|nr:hypothetical protein CCHR01_07254 [Colletotrichum chrysophilum]